MKAKKAIYFVSLLAAVLLLFWYFQEQRLSIERLHDEFIAWTPILVGLLAIVLATHLFLIITTPIVKKLLLQSVTKRREIRTAILLWKYFIWFVAMLLIFTQISGDLTTLGISVGLIGAGMAFALQQPLMCFVGWVTVIVNKPYTLGDRITIGKYSGDVAEINMLYTVLDEFDGELGYEDPTGRTITVPNSSILTQPITNYTFANPFIWGEVYTTVTYESNHKLAKKIILEAASEEVGELMKEAYDAMYPWYARSDLEQYIFNKPQTRAKFKDSSLE